jgi:hypothetical protein
MAGFFKDIKLKDSEDLRELAVPQDKNFDIGLWGGDEIGRPLTLVYDKNKLRILANPNGKELAKHTRVFTFTPEPTAIGQIMTIKAMYESRQFAQIDVEVTPPKTPHQALSILNSEPEWTNSVPSAWLLATPAKSMSHDDARQCYGYFRAMGWIHTGASSQLQKTGSAAAANWTDFTKVNISLTICGVDFRYGGDFNKSTEAARKKAIQSWSILSLTSPIDTRLIVFMVRLARKLTQDYNCSNIYTNGIITANRDAHQHGRALDFLGFEGNVEGGIWDVYDDWGIIGVKWATTKITRANGDEFTPVAPYKQFRFNANPELRKSKPRTPEIVANLMDFFTTEVQDATPGPDDDQTRGIGSLGNSSYLVQPDHPDPALATAHINHFHLQIGDTR